MTTKLTTTLSNANVAIDVTDNMLFIHFSKEDDSEFDVAVAKGEFIQWAMQIIFGMKPPTAGKL
jgi:hypothetical protein